MKIDRCKSIILFIFIISAFTLLTGCKSDEEKYDDLIWEAKSLAHDGKTSKAEKKYDEAIKFMPEKATAYLELYKLYIDEEEYEQAEAILDEAGENVTDRSEKKKVDRKIEEFKESGYLVLNDNPPTTPEPPTEEPPITDGPEPTGPSIISDDPYDAPGVTASPEPVIDEPTPTLPTVNPDPGGPDDCMDLGGMEIVICDWWSDGLYHAPQTDYEEARDYYRLRMMEKFNFIVKEERIADYDHIAGEYVDYTTNGGDDRNLVFVLHNNRTILMAMESGLMYRLSNNPDILDFSEERFMNNRIHEKYMFDGDVAGFNFGYAPAGAGIYFNENILRDAGIDPDDIYEMQENGTWTWDAFEEILKTTQDYLDNSKYIYPHEHAFSCDKNLFVNYAVFSNGGEYIGKDEQGNFTYRLEDADTTEGLEWAVKILSKYFDHEPEDAAEDYYRQEFISWNAVFLADYASASADVYNDLTFDVGFVMFPKGPRSDTYVNLAGDTFLVIPACYGDERVRKISFALSMYYSPIPGYEDVNERLVDELNAYNMDDKALFGTLYMMHAPKNLVVTYHDVILGINIEKDLLNYIYPGTDVHLAQMKAREAWQDVKEFTVPLPEIPEITPALEPDFVLPDSDKRYIDESELDRLSAWGCKVARNEIYARHGRKFKDEELQEYFDSKSWYKGTIAPDDFDDSVLNDFENVNKNIITKYEKEKGYR